MPSGQSSEISALIGDFFHAHAKNNRELLDESLSEMQRLLYHEKADVTPFKDYFNNVYSDRNPYNTSLSVSDYPKESILRELLQNAFGCYYSENDMKLTIDFEDNGVIKLNYNEDGFTLEQLLYYLSIGRSDGDTTREGRFGVGAKSVFMNVEWFTLRSGNFTFRMINDDGVLLLRELDLSAPLYQGTEIRFCVSREEAEAIKENLLTLTAKKGKYINLVELCFAFIRKKLPGRYDECEAVSRTITVTAAQGGKPFAVYRISRRGSGDSEGDPLIRFSHNGKSVIDFIWHEAAGYVYLIPFAVSSARRADMARVILDRYNYFSTYELTGLINSTGEQFVNQKLSAFFISVPNSLITSHRTGIKHECEEEVAQAISGDLRDMCDKYSRYFVLEIAKRSSSDKLYLRPKHYVFEFFANFIQTSPMANRLDDKFQSNISLCPPGGTPIPYSELCQIGFYNDEPDIPYAMHESGAAFDECIQSRIMMLRKETANFENVVLSAAYEWENPETGERGREFSYIFRFGDKSYRIDSDKNPAIKDYGLSVGFRSVVSIKLGDYVKDGSVADDDSLIGAVTLFDDIFGNSYGISMRYYQLNVRCRTSRFTFDVAKMTVNNLKRTYDFIAAHADRFENNHVLNEFLTLLVNSYTQGKDVMTFLRQMKSEGTEIGLQLDINNKYRFSAYGMQFLIPSKVTCNDLLEIVGDVYLLISCGMFNGRLFDFPVSKAGYSFDRAKITELLSAEEAVAKRYDSILPRLYVTDLKIPRIALVDKENRVVRVLDTSVVPVEEDEARTEKYVVLKDGCQKPEFSHYVEYLLTGVDDGKLGRYYSCTEEPNRVLLDQIPYYYKPLPYITQSELTRLKEQYEKIRGIDNAGIYRNYFAKDINGRLFGYGGTCQCCPRESQIINSRVVKSFEVGIFKDESERRFRFSLYMCSDDAAASSGWIIEDVSIGGMSPFLWLEEISQVEVIPPEFLLCSIKYRCQLTYDIAGSENIHSEMLSSTESELMSINTVLSPLMAAKWIADNTEADLSPTAFKAAEEDTFEPQSEEETVRVLDLSESE